MTAEPDRPIRRQAAPAESQPVIARQPLGRSAVPVQTKLAVGSSDDPFEREADRMADTVVASLQRSMDTAAGTGRIRARTQTDVDEGGVPAAANVAVDDHTVVRRVETPVASTPQGPEQAAAVPVVPIAGAHETVSADPITVAGVRSAVASKSVTSADDAGTFLAARVAELRGLGLSTSVPDQAGLIPVLAADMKRKDQQLPEAERKNLDDAGWTSAASSQILGNQTTALTTSDDRYTEIEGGAKFDELHEFIHICSAPGGESALMGFKLQVNEGAINYFSQLAAAKAQVPIVGRYATETDIVTRLVNLAGPNGPSKLYDATFKGDIDGFFAEVGRKYVANGKFKGFSERSWTAEQAAAAFKDEARKWGTKFIQDRT